MSGRNGFQKRGLVFGTSIFLLAFLLSQSLIVGPQKAGVVRDRDTDNPIEGIFLVRETEEYRASLEGPLERVIRRNVTTSDKDGKFFFPSFVLLRMPFTNKYRELLYVNPFSEFGTLNGEYFEIRSNEMFSEEIVGLGFGNDQSISQKRPYEQGGQTFKPFGDETVIRLTPRSPW